MDVRLLPDGSIRWRDRWGGIRIEPPLVRIADAAAPPGDDAACPF